MATSPSRAGPPPPGGGGRQGRRTDDRPGSRVAPPVKGTTMPRRPQVATTLTDADVYDPELTILAAGGEPETTIPLTNPLWVNRPRLHGGGPQRDLKPHPDAIQIRNDGAYIGGPRFVMTLTLAQARKLATELVAELLKS